MKIYLSFFEHHIKPVFRKDTNAMIGQTLVALAYPSVVMIGPPPFFNDAIVDVKKEGLCIEPDKFPLYQFLNENPEICEKVIRGHGGLSSLFESYLKAQNKNPLQG